MADVSNPEESSTGYLVNAVFHSNGINSQQQTISQQSVVPGPQHNHEQGQQQMQLFNGSVITAAPQAAVSVPNGMVLGGNNPNNTLTAWMQSPFYQAFAAQIQAGNTAPFLGFPTDGANVPQQSLTAVSRPTFVNAKQFKRILKRREARARLEEYYQKRRKETGSKPYMHESRHRHAMKRPRGPGGRFLTKSELEKYYDEHPEQDPKRIKTEG